MAEIYLREGSKVYQGRLKVDGQVLRRSTGCGCPKAAQQEADRLEEQLNQELKQETDIHLLDGLSLMFKNPMREKPFSNATVRNYTLSCSNIIAVLGNFALRLLDEEKLRHYIKVKKKTGHSVQLRRDLAFLSSLFSHVLHFQWDPGVTSNPARQISRSGIPEADKRKVHTQYHEFEKVLAACANEEQRRFVILAVFTGMRHQEIMKLHWNEVSLDRRLIQLGGERTKNSEPRKIPLHDMVFDTLSNTLPSHREGYVFKGKKEDEPQYSFSKRWSGIRQRAGMPELRIHDLRHTFASWLKQSDVAESTIMELLGHKTRSMVERYAHDSVRSLRTAVGRIDANTLSDTLPAD